jgi:hypothetical protein
VGVVWEDAAVEVMMVRAGKSASNSDLVRFRPTWDTLA